jgi:hypothetical protein
MVFWPYIFVILDLLKINYLLSVILQNGGQLCVFVLGVFNDFDYPYGSRTVATYNVMMNYLYTPPTKVGGCYRCPARHIFVGTP